MQHDWHMVGAANSLVCRSPYAVQLPVEIHQGSRSIRGQECSVSGVLPHGAGSARLCDAQTRLLGDRRRSRVCCQQVVARHCLQLIVLLCLFLHHMACLIRVCGLVFNKHYGDATQPEHHLLLSCFSQPPKTSLHG